MNWKSILALVLAIPIVNYVGGKLGESAAEETNARRSQIPAETSAAQSKPLHTAISIQDAEGITQDQMDLEFLKNLEAYILERTKINAQKYLASIGKADQLLEITSEATYVQSGHLKLAVIRLNDAASRQVLVAGFVGKELKRVLCARESLEAIPITYGPCADKIKEAFGITIGG